MSAAQTIGRRMDSPLRPIGFEQFLTLLAPYIGERVRIALHFAGHHLGSSATGRLVAVESVPPDSMAATLRLSSDFHLDLDPEETRAFVVGKGKGAGGWLELWIDDGQIAITIEEPPSEASG